MSEIKQGTKVRDRKWGGRFTGTVIRVEKGGPWYYVAWDGTCVEDQMAAHEIEPIDG